MSVVSKKRFVAGGDVWRLVVEGNILRVDEWIDGWAIYAHGRVVAGKCVDLAIIGDLFVATPMPRGMVAAVDAVLAEIPACQRQAACAAIHDPHAATSDPHRARTGDPHARRINVGYYGSAARRLGMTAAAYIAQKEAGMSWCSRGRHWTAEAVSAGGLVCPACKGPRKAEVQEAA